MKSLTHREIAEQALGHPLASKHLVHHHVDEFVRARFWIKVKKTEKCWLWAAGRIRGGYGEFKINRNTVLAHRVSWFLTYGPIPPGLFVCHKCDVPYCVRPDHLFLGTPKDNQIDAASKGRLPTGNKHWARLCPERVTKGEGSPFAKLNNHK